MALATTTAAAVAAGRCREAAFQHVLTASTVTYDQAEHCSLSLYECTLTPQLPASEKSKAKDAAKQIKDLQEEVASLKAKLLMADQERNCVVKEKEFDIRMAMAKEVSDAYDKGFSRCKESFKEMKELMQD